MAAQGYGPVEFYLVGFEGDELNTAVLDELHKLTASRMVRLLDLVLVTKDEHGTVTFTEPETLEAVDTSGYDLGATGIAGLDDIEDLAQALGPGTSAVLVVLELLYQRALAERVSAAGGELLAYDRVPAPVVNALMDTLVESTEE